MRALLMAVAAALVSAPSAAGGPLRPVGVTQSGRTVIVIDRTANAVYAIAPGSHRLRVLAHLPRPTAVAASDAAHVLVASGRSIVRLDVRTGKKRILTRVRQSGPILALATAPRAIYASVAGGSIVVQIDAQKKSRVLLTNRLDVRGLLVQAGKLIVCERGESKFLVWNLAKKRLDVDARVPYASGVIAAPSGWYVSDSHFGYVYHVSPVGTAKWFVKVPGVFALATAPDGTFVATTLGGRVVRVYPQTHAVTSILRGGKSTT